MKRVFNVTTEFVGLISAFVIPSLIRHRGNDVFRLSTLKLRGFN
jgi:hypothetical protein